MKPVRIIFTAVLLVCALALFADDYFNEISFRNKTGNTIYYLFFSPGDSEYWGPDVLGSTRTFDSGEEIGYYISFPGESADFDFKAVDEAGNVYELYGNTMVEGEVARIVITPDKMTENVDIDDFEEGLVALEINNLTGFELYYLFISPADSDMYGIDFMDYETTLMPDDSMEILMFASDDGIAYDLMAIDADDDSYSFQLTVEPGSQEQWVDISIDDLD